MDRDDEDFALQLLATFKVEAREHVEAILAGLLKLEQSSDEPEASKQLESIFRHAHSLKGAARAVNAAEVEALCQALENVFSACRQGRIRLSGEVFDVMHRAMDRVVSRLDPEPGKDPGKSDSRNQVRELEGLVGAHSPPTQSSGESGGDLPAPEIKSFSETAAGSAPAGAAQSPDETIRVSAGKLDRLLRQAEEMLVAKQTAAQRAADLLELETAIAEAGRPSAGLRLSRRAERGTVPSGEGKPEPAEVAGILEFGARHQERLKALESRVRRLAAATVQDARQLGRMVDDLFAEAKELVMVPFSTLSSLLSKLVRDLGREQGKTVDLFFQGGGVEVDRRILEQMKDPLIHMIRNAVDHGVEPADVRVRRNKAPRSALLIKAARAEGNKVQIVVADDGAGVDLDRVRASAVKRGVVEADQARALSDAGVLDLIFQPSVSTRAAVSEISGRGLGLAIVREKADRLGGRVSAHLRPQGGTEFRMILPASLASFRGVFVRAAGGVFVLPLASIDRAVRIGSDDIETVRDGETIALDDGAIPWVRLSDVLEIGGDRSQGRSSQVSGVVLGEPGSRIAFEVDEVLCEDDILAQPLAPPLARVRNTAGACLDASGRVIPILNVEDLLKSAQKLGGAFLEAGAEAVAGRPKILVAEDSVSSRLWIKGALESAGYEVTAAGDGAAAWSELKSGVFNMVVSDVEMPRVNGLELIARIRADDRLAGLPVVLVTARDSEEDRAQGMAAGADAYLTKSSLNQSDLIKAVRRLAR